MLEANFVTSCTSHNLCSIQGNFISSWRSVVKQTRLARKETAM